MRELCKINVHIHVIQSLPPHCSRAPALPGAKIDVASICGAECAASPASPLSSLVYRSRYPKTKDELRSVVVMVILLDANRHVKSKEEKDWKEER